MQYKFRSSHLRNFRNFAKQGVPFRHPLPNFQGPAGNGRAFFLFGLTQLRQIGRLPRELPDARARDPVCNMPCEHLAGQDPIMAGMAGKESDG